MTRIYSLWLLLFIVNKKKQRTKEGINPPPVSVGWKHLRQTNSRHVERYNNNCDIISLREAGIALFVPLQFVSCLCLPEAQMWWWWCSDKSHLVVLLLFCSARWTASFQPLPLPSAHARSAPLSQRRAHGEKRHRILHQKPNTKLQ